MKMMEEMDKIISLLKEKGYILSTPRIVIIKYLLSNKTHHTAESIHRAISKEFPAISLATVYNTLKLLSKEGIVTELYIEGERIFYDSTPGEHSHFICKICGKIKDVENKVEYKPKIDGDRVEKIYVYYYGVCEECIKSGKGQTKTDKNKT